MNDMLEKDLEEYDPELYRIIAQESERQRLGLELIASENFTSRSVLQCLGSCLHNKYSEGLPGKRYYGGNEYIDEIEILAQRRCLEAFGLSPSEWGCNVQPYSGSPANFAVYTGLLEPHGRIMGLDLPDGGHLTHGFFTNNKKISATSIFFESMPYKVNPDTGLIDYDQLSYDAKLFKPKIIIAGVSCYSRCLDYKKFREIADENNAYLFSDMAHIAGLVAAGIIPSPFKYSDVVSTTTHKTLRGPRAGVIFYRKGIRDIRKNGETVMYDLEDKINQAVFPGLQGGPHNHAIAGIAVAMKQATTHNFFKYQEQVVANAKRLCSQLQNLGYKISTDGTDLHMLLVDLRSNNLTGSKAEKVLETISIACNKNTVPGDKSALNPHGLRLGTPALTTRGLKEEDFDRVAIYIHKGLQLANEITLKSGPKLVDFNNVLKSDATIQQKVNDLKEEVENFAGKFPLPGLF
ncbi:PREDICTED: serine hydroxymethyltransferase, cytosolic [Ceratosolen solmsi marchali]|uniref:Serine hydroxymethyltransferase n=1 Tax=Ceratosolen solmsi marchali TaxID=326594 RepID=A0AAJ7E2R3_9HYME|nr:PREDICTED: serine hydroxymethyltransferase, cytosolic [Ceratosolen solmsi marchali]